MSQVVAIQEQQWTPEQMKLITDVVAPNASPNELKLFLYRCQNMGLDPLKPGMIHFVKYGNGPGTIVVGIEGFRTVAHRSGKLSGIKRGALKDDKGVLIGAWAEVYRTDWTQPAREEVPLAEYDTKRGPWSKMPETMIKKVAEAAALRMAFPDSLGGVYSQEEMEQAKNIPPVVAPQQPGEEDGCKDFADEYRIPFGKFKGRSIEEIDHNQLRSYVNYLEDKAKKDGKMIQGQVLTFIEHVDSYLGAFENAPLEATAASYAGVK